MALGFLGTVAMITAGGARSQVGGKGEANRQSSAWSAARLVASATGRTRDPFVLNVTGRAVDGGFTFQEAEATWLDPDRSALRHIVSDKSNSPTISHELAGERSAATDGALHRVAAKLGPDVARALDEAFADYDTNSGLRHQQAPGDTIRRLDHHDRDRRTRRIAQEPGPIGGLASGAPSQPISRPRQRTDSVLFTQIMAAARRRRNRP
jgi:hypothetical protein